MSQAYCLSPFLRQSSVSAVGFHFIVFDRSQFSALFSSCAMPFLCFCCIRRFKCLSVSLTPLYLFSFRVFSSSGLGIILIDADKKKKKKKSLSCPFLFVFCFCFVLFFVVVVCLFAVNSEG